MSDKNHFKPTGWRSRLESLDEVPAELPFHKNAAWDKLSARLEAPAKKNNPYTWWFAAAALIAGLLFTIIKDNPPVADQMQKQVHTTNKKTSNAIVPVQTVTAKATKNFSAIPGETMQQKTTSPASKPTSVIPAHTENNQHALTAANPVVVSLLPPPVAEEIKAIPALAIAPPQFQKKKLTVVYLNEIEPVPSGLLTKRLQSKKNFPRYQKPIQSGTDDVFVATEPKRFTINLSSAN